MRRPDAGGYCLPRAVPAISGALIRTPDVVRYPRRDRGRLLIQVLYSIRSDGSLMEQLDRNLLFRWFVGLTMDYRIWDPTVFAKNRDRLLRGEIAQLFFDQVLAQARDRDLPSDERHPWMERWGGVGGG